MAGTIHVRIVAVGGLVFDVRRRNRDATGPLFRRLVDLVVRRERRTAGLGEDLGDGRGQRRLAMIDVADRANVAVRLVTLEFSFTHRPISVPACCPGWGF